MSEVKVNKISPRTNCGTTTLGDSGDTFSIPAGVTISNSGTATGFGSTGEVSWNTTKITADPGPAVSGIGYFTDTSGAAFNVTLPLNPSAGAVVAVADYANTWDTKHLTIARNGQNIEGAASNFVCNIEGGAITFVFVDATKGWIATNSGNTTDVFGERYITATGGNAVITCGNYKTHIFTGPGTFCVSQAGNSAGEDTADYFVVAAGGGGGLDTYPGSRIGGGGGGGAIRISNCATRSGIATPVMSPLVTTTGITVTATAYPITVGAGGTAGSGTSSPGVSGGRGNNSIFSTITSTGGGGGGGHTPGPGGPTCQTPGGSGGAFQGAIPCGTKGLGNTPPVSPPQGNNAGDGGDPPAYSGGGGGGAGAVGGNADPSPGAGGDGGAGSFLADAFIGPTAPSYGESGPVSNTRYFAGGGGSAGPPGPPSGGVGGGGNGANCATDCGSTNMGGGAGGRRNTGGTAAGTGGSGIVIIRYKYQ